MTTLPPLVGLIGKKRVGKDTFAAVLVEEFGFARVAFADPLKEMALTIDPIIDDLSTTSVWNPVRLAPMVDADGWERVKDTYPEARRFLQRLGDGVRQFDPELWVQTGMLDVADLRRAGTDNDFYGPAMPVVITDVRYPNEADAIREAGGTLVRIVRPEVDDGDAHASETALDGYAADLQAFNHSTVQNLQDQARVIAGIVSL